MTSKEHVALQRFVNRVQIEVEESDRVFEELQDLSESCGCPRWCCAETNFREVLTNGEPLQRSDAARLYKRYLAANARREVYHELMSELAELNFWRAFSLEEVAK